MRLIIKNSAENSLRANELNRAEAYWETLAASKQTIVNQEYHELAEQAVSEMDSMAQLFANIETLADLQGRLSFVMREVKYLVKA